MRDGWWMAVCLTGTLAGCLGEDKAMSVPEAVAGGDAEVPVDLLGTGFQQRVWDALMKIPAGETVSYAGLAQSLGAPRAARAVASACARNVPTATSAIPPRTPGSQFSAISATPRTASASPPHVARRTPM